MAISNVSSVTKHFPYPNEGFTTTTTGTVTAGAGAIPLSSVSGLTNGAVFVGIIEPGVSGNEQTFTGTVDTGGSQISGVVWTRGTNVDHAGGVTVVDYVTGTGLKIVSKGILVQHAQDGTHGNITGTGLSITGTTAFNGVYQGWVGANESWSWATTDAANATYTVTVPSDATVKYSDGMRVRLTDNSATKYFIITKVATTTLTLYGGTDYTLSGGSITSPAYSSQKAPFGFPLDPTKWTVSVTSSATTALTGSWSNAGAINLSIPIGAWKIFGNATANSTRTGAIASEVSCMLSESATAVTTGYETTIDTINTGGASGSIIAGMTFRPNIDKTFTTATTVYLDFITVATTGNLYVARGNVHGIRAVCAYL